MRLAPHVAVGLDIDQVPGGQLGQVGMRNHLGAIQVGGRTTDERGDAVKARGQLLARRFQVGLEPRQELEKGPEPLSIQHQVSPGAQVRLGRIAGIRSCGDHPRSPGM